jgi:enoyl-CoA hydratase/carnithine racemase
MLVLGATDPAFCAGLDLKDFSAADSPRGEVSDPDLIARLECVVAPLLI